MDENNPQYKKIKERKWEVHRSILKYEGIFYFVSN